MNNQNIQFLKAPYVTEKTSRLTEESNQYVFKVSLDSTKLKIKKAVEGSYVENTSGLVMATTSNPSALKTKAN